MQKRWISLVLAGLLLQSALFVQPVAAVTRPEKQARLTEKVKTGILNFGVGKDARINLTLRNGSKLAGYISEAREDFFVVGGLNSADTTVVSYPDVRKVKGHNLSTGAKVAIVGLSIAVGLLAFFLWLENAD